MPTSVPLYFALLILVGGLIAFEGKSFKSALAPPSKQESSVARPIEAEHQPSSPIIQPQLSVPKDIPVEPSIFRKTQPNGQQILLADKYPIRWRMGKIDPRFHIDAETVKRAALRALNLWELAARRRLFTYDENSGCPVELVFDERQERLNAGDEAKQKLRQQEDGLNQAKDTEREAMSRYEQVKKVFNVENADHVANLDTYNRQVNYWNSVGNPPGSVTDELNSERASLTAERGSLEATEQELESMRTKANTLVEAYNERAMNYTKAQESFNQKYACGNVDAVGVCVSRGGRPETVTVYAFTSDNHLARVLAHEFGHALGIKHVHVDGAVMSPMDKGDSPSTELRLTKADMAALTTLLKNDGSISNPSGR